MNYNGRKWYIINWESGWKRCKKIFTLYTIVDQTNIDLFLLFGYKILSPGDKETFYLLQNLAKLNKNKKGKYECRISIGYLALVLGTTSSCQSRRIKKLKEANLLINKSVGRSRKNATLYVPMEKILPDSTLISTVIDLIRRKYLIQYIGIYNKEKDITQRLSILNKIKKMVKKNPKYKDLLYNGYKNLSLSD